jgi:hypothetical protein
MASIQGVGAQGVTAAQQGLAAAMGGISSRNGSAMDGISTKGLQHQGVT